MLEHFFSSAPAGLTQIVGSYHPGLVLLSVFVAVVLSLLALQMAQSAQKTTNPSYRAVTLGTGAIALGSGIWTMHFIGMFAFYLPAPVHYRTGLTLLSMLPAAGAAWVALAMLTQPTISRLQLIGSGVIMGAGIGTMHYGGMMAIETPLHMRHSPGLFFLSIVVAVGLAMLAIWIRFGLQHTRLSLRSRFWLSGVVMGCAISGMHYTAMQAAQFYGVAQPVPDGMWISTNYVALALSSVTLTIALTVAAVNGLIYSRELNREVMAGKQRLIAIFDTAVDSIITITPQGIVQEFSQAAERMFGYQRDEVVGNNVKMLMPNPYRAEHDGYLQRYLDTGVAHIMGSGREVVGQRKDQSTFPMRLAVGEVHLPNDELLFVGLITDITERKALEESLRAEAEKAQQAAVAKSDFLANMSHEIRTQMNAIIGFTELLLQTELPSQQQGYLTTIRQASRSLLGLLNDILDTSKLDSGRFELEQADFSLKVLAAQIESTLSISAAAKGLPLVVDYPDALPEYFVGDGLRILQILTNLVGNAIKFTERGRIDLHFSVENAQVHIQVQDTGIGMSAQQQATIFEAFTQADASISRRFGGTGLGTTISRQLVEAMQGRITVESQLGQGSIFHVWLPLPVGEKPAVDVMSTPVMLPPLKILIADDIEQNRELLILTLSRHGHQVSAAANGEEALLMAEQGGFDLVLMDVHMPVVDGLQATQRIREQELRQHKRRLPIIALTASVMASDRKIALQAGMDGFAVKPLDIPQLFNEIQRVLSNVQDSHPMPAFAASALERTAASGGHAVVDIDWARGQSLWGSRAEHEAQIQRFLTQLDTNYPLPDYAPQQVETLKFSLHGLKGVAGNLGLMALVQRVQELEALARTERWPQLQLALTQLRQYVQQLHTQLPHAAVSATTNPPAPFPNVQELARALEQVQQQLQHHEIHDASVVQLLALLPTADQCALKALLDNFEFDQATALLTSWRAALEPMDE